MKIRIYEFPNSKTPPYLKDENPVERGYIEIPDDKVMEYDADKCWDICNWSHWAVPKKPECLHSDISHCDHGIVFVYPSDLDSDGLHVLALSNGWLRGPKDFIQQYATAHKDKVLWVNAEQEKLLEDNENNNIANYKQIQASIQVGRVYRHFKGKHYLVLAIAKHSETGDPFVVYKALYGDCQVYIRPFMMFASEVDRKKYPDVKQEFRFELVEDNEK